MYRLYLAAIALGVAVLTLSSCRGITSTSEFTYLTLSHDAVRLNPGESTTQNIFVEISSKTLDEHGELTIVELVAGELTDGERPLI